jgi:putative transposase
LENPNNYPSYRYPAQIISHTVWLYRRFTLSFRDIEELFAARGIVVSYKMSNNWSGGKGLSILESNFSKYGTNLKTLKGNSLVDATKYVGILYGLSKGLNE